MKPSLALSLIALMGGCAYDEGSLSLGSHGTADDTVTENLHPSKNPNGKHATFSTRGFVDQTGEYFQAQGSNGRSCVTCHLGEDAWAINPSTVEEMFEETDGLHPIFNPLDATNPNTNDFLTVEGRRAAYAMMISKGVFRRGGAPRAVRDWDITAVDDPNGFATTNRLVHWRRSMPTINFPLGTTRINWDGGNQAQTTPPTIRGGLERQATGNVTGGQQGPPAPASVIADIVDLEIELFAAQTHVQGIGNLVENGSTGGPEQLASQTREIGRFDLFDAWIGDHNAKRAQIARGQELFNNPNPGGRRCGGCHNVRNNGTNFNNTMFNIETASAAKRTPDLTLHTFTERSTGATVQLTDAGFGQVTGLFADLGKFKAPTIRALSARAPYFHDGSAATLDEVVRHYEDFFGFVFTDAERADLVAFLAAL